MASLPHLVSLTMTSPAPASISRLSTAPPSPHLVAREVVVGADAGRGPVLVVDVPLDGPGGDVGVRLDCHVLGHHHDGLAGPELDGHHHGIARLDLGQVELREVDDGVAPLDVEAVLRLADGLDGDGALGDGGRVRVVGLVHEALDLAAAHYGVVDPARDHAVGHRHVCHAEQQGDDREEPEHDRWAAAQARDEDRDAEHDSPDAQPGRREASGRRAEARDVQRGRAARSRAPASRITPSVTPTAVPPGPRPYAGRGRGVDGLRRGGRGGPDRYCACVCR